MSDQGEQEPLLGRPGDAAQIEGKPIYHNLYLGTVPQQQEGDRLANGEM
jgi:hypothetical protein